MTNLVLLHRADSIYEDEPETKYDFPKSYLKAMTEAIGDWVVYYEPVKAGPRGYFAAAQIADIIEKPGTPDRYIAVIAPGTFLPFDTEVPRLRNGRPMEAALTAADGTPKSGGAQQLAVRRLPEADFEAIVSLGLPDNLEAVEAARYDGIAGLAEDTSPFDRPVIERLTRRPYRNVAFRRKVREAYDYRCAISELQLRNGGGRPEVQAAHIRPVEEQGSDSVRNGLALSGTLHWMFDRGLVSVSEDRSILISHNKVPSDVANRLIGSERKLILPKNERDWPHPAYLQWHRENRFGQVSADGPAPWG